jgi:hypothetical protein
MASTSPPVYPEPPTFTTPGPQQLAAKLATTAFHSFAADRVVLQPDFCCGRSTTCAHALTHDGAASPVKAVGLPRGYQERLG